MSETTLGALARAVGDSLGVRILSPEFEILLNLYDHGDLSAGELRRRSSASSTAFYARLKLLTVAGAIALEKREDDRRVSAYTLGAETRRIMDEAFQALDGWAESKTGTPATCGASFDWHLAKISNQLDLNLFSPEFSIIANVYDSEPIGTSELFYKTRLANSKFYATLTLLTARRTIRSLVDASDRRRRIDCLPRGVRSQLDQVLHDFRISRPQREPA